MRSIVRKDGPLASTVGFVRPLTAENFLSYQTGRNSFKVIV